jgi:hypothetical protein
MRSTFVVSSSLPLAAPDSPLPAMAAAMAAAFDDAAYRRQIIKDV